MALSRLPLPVVFLSAALFCLADEKQAQPPQREVVVVTGVPEPVPLEEADRSVRSLDVREGLLLSNSVADFLRLDPALDLQQRAPGGIQADLSIRGASFGQTLVLLNGLRLNDAQSGHHNLDLPIPLESVDRIEVLKGSGSTLYGSDAVGGVVNVLTKAPEASEVRLRAALGSFGTNEQRLSMAGVLGRLTQTLTASRQFSSGFIPDRDYRNSSIGATTTILTSLGNTDVVLAASDKPFGALNFYGAYPSWERTKTWFASVRQELGDATEAAFAFRRHTDLFVLYRDRPQVYTNHHAVESIQGSVRRTEMLGSNTKLLYGVEGYGDRIESSNLGRHSRARGAAYAFLDVRALRRFSFSVGGREEIYGSFERELSPSAAVGLWLSPQVKLRAGVSRAFRIPTYTDLYYRDPATRGAADLRPESAWSYEGGLDWNTGRRVRGDITVFRREDRDLIDYVRAGASEMWHAANINSLHFTGVETGLAAQLPGSQRLDLRYTALHGARAALGGLQSRYIMNYPEHSAMAGWQGGLPGGLVGRTRLGASARINRSPYAIWDIYFARSRGTVHPFVQFSNLTASRYEEIAGVAMPGRSVLGGIEIVFQGR